MIKAILLDIDNTLYDYNEAHSKGLNAVFDFASLLFCREDFINAFNFARNQINNELKGTASSHNRILYFQRTLELLKYDDILIAKKLYDTYWNNFLENMKLFDGVIEFLEQNDKTICFLTDLTAYIQYRKLEKTGLFKYCKYIVTSEEAGREKPDKKIFNLALKKLNMSPDEVCMIGDSWDRDICGALELNIKSYWKTDKEAEDKRVTVFNDFRELIGKI